MIKIGLDIHGVSDADQAFFAELTTLLVNAGHEVHILTGAEQTPQLESYLKNEIGLLWTHFFSITSHHLELHTPITYIKSNPYMDDEIWNQTKAEYCATHNIQLHLDDSDVYGRFFKTPYARYHGLRPTAKPCKIAILGGSFNPVTLAHVRAAEIVLEHFPDTQQVWMMPAFQHPFDKHIDYCSRRIEMLHMIASDKIRYFGYEIDHQLSGETFTTVMRLIQDPDYQNYSFSMIIGSDCLCDFDTKWKNAETLAKTIRFIILPRSDYPCLDYDGLLSKPPHVILKNASIPLVSATDIRKRITEGQSIRGLVPRMVEDFIIKKQLFKANLSV